MLQPTTTPKRHQSLFRCDKVESTVHSKITSGRRHMDHVERLNTSMSPKLGLKFDITTKRHSNDDSSSRYKNEKLKKSGCCI